MVTFGKAKKDAPAQSDGAWLRNFQKGDTTVRFIDEIDDWVYFKEHYKANKHWYPCTMESDCPGCNADTEEERKRGTKYGTNLLEIKSGDVKPYKLPVSLVNILETRAERQGGTITNRDYAIIRSGAGFDTKYDADSEASYELDLKPLRGQAADIEEILKAQFEAETDIAVTPTKVVNKAKKAKVEETIPFEEAPVTQAPETVLDESVVRSMTIPQLTELANDAGVDLGKAESRTEMADILIEALG